MISIIIIKLYLGKHENIVTLEDLIINENSDNNKGNTNTTTKILILILILILLIRWAIYYIRVTRQRSA